MTAPIRLRLSRARGFRLREVSRAANGLPAVNCARPGRWGNPYRVDPPEHAVELHASWVDNAGESTREIIRSYLAGKNLACWCALDAPCHVDTLLRIANQEPTQ